MFPPRYSNQSDTRSDNHTVAEVGSGQGVYSGSGLCWGVRLCPRSGWIGEVGRSRVGIDGGWLKNVGLYGYSILIAEELN